MLVSQMAESPQKQRDYGGIGSKAHPYDPALESMAAGQFTRESSRTTCAGSARIIESSASRILQSRVDVSDSTNPFGEGEVMDNTSSPLKKEKKGKIHSR